MIDTTSQDNIFVVCFKELFSKIDSELSKLILLEKEKE